MINRFWAFARMGRVWNGILVVASVLIGGYFTGSITPGVWLGSLSAFLIATGAYALNDFFDWKIDKINKPTRPISAGDVPARTALTFGLLVVLAGVVISYFINTKSFFAAFISGFLAIQYAMVFKRVMIVGHIVTAFLSAFGFLFGAWAAEGSRMTLALYAFLFGFLFHLGREFLKAAEDREADLEGGAKTFAVLTSAKHSVIVAAIILAILGIVAWMPFFTENFNWIYLIIVIFGIDLVFVFLLVRALRNPIPSVLSKVNSYLKWEMVVGLLALWMGKYLTP